jgi:glucose-6-phosphate isomerase
MTPIELWDRYQRYYCYLADLDLSIDISRIQFDDSFFATMAAEMERAYDAMDALEDGAIANPTEQRMVGHYWLRAPEVATDPQITRAIAENIDAVKKFAAQVHGDGLFQHLLWIGIGGSALGPMFVADALGNPANDRIQPHFLDNTDPDGFERVFAPLQGKLGRTLTVVTSKTGNTPETTNAMTVAARAYESDGVDFPSHAVAITMPRSKLDRLAETQG